MKRRCTSAAAPSDADAAAAVYGWQKPGPSPQGTPPEGLAADPAPSGAAVGLDVILDTVSAPHDVEPYLGLLSTDGTLVLIGLVTKPFHFAGNALVFSQKAIRGSLIGGTARTAEMLNYCCGHDIYPDVNVIGADDVSETLQRLEGLSSIYINTHVTNIY